ncbi:MAG TPA: WD40 repeat domain-containing protein, partial [Gemmataceae bacterium]
MAVRSQRFPRCLYLFLIVLLLVLDLVSEQASAKPSRTDRFGDLLPPGAIARLGTLRLRHGSSILALAFSPDGKMLASGGADNRVSIWDAATGKELHRLPNVESTVKTVVFSPDGKLLALVTKKGRSIYLQDAATGKELRKVKLDTHSVEMAAFSPDGKFLAWGSDKTVHLWDVDAAKEIEPLKGFGQRIGFLSFTPDGKALLVGSSTDDPHSTVGEITRRDLTTGNEIRRFKVDRDGGSVDEAGAVRLAALSPNDKHLVSIGEDDALRCWELSSGEEIWRLRRADGQWMALGLSPDGKLLAVSNWQRGEGGVVKLCDAATGRVLRQLQGLSDLTTRIVFSPDGKAIATAGWYRCVRFFDPATGLELPRMFGHQAEVHTAVFCRDGERVATGADDGSFRIWEAATGKELRRIDNSGGRGCQVASFDGKRLILMDDSSPIR